MIDRISVDELYHTVVVVDDAKAMAKNYALFFGIDKWKVINHTRKRLSHVTAYGRGTSRPELFQIGEDDRSAGEYEFITAEGQNPTNGVSFQLVQPTGGLSLFEEHLVTRGNGIHSLFLTVADQNKFSELHQFLAGEGVRVRQSYTIDDAADVYFFDTRKAGGYYVKVVVPRVENWRDAITVDEEWDFSKEVSRPEHARAMTQIPSLGHFGVVVHNLMDSMEHASRIFGQPVWRGMHWSSFTGSLMDCTNNGVSVDHAYFTSMGTIGKNFNLGPDFGFEMIQPTFGPSNYKEDFLLAVGEGIHHVDLRIPFETFEDFVGTDFWWREIGAPVCMSGWLNKKNVPYPQFQYQDTRNLLGFVCETHAAHQTPIDGPPPAPGSFRMTPRYMHDYSAKVEL